MGFRLATYAVCIDDGWILLTRHVPEGGEGNWTFLGGGVEHAEDPFDAVTRELAEETGCVGLVGCLLQH
ncbi:NUDIX hydrolase [Tomitella biformata]|uniref:NUDIX hydrolase n=1 Tax=Tomitella biformata TaxID=630403 RepID=UPI0004ADF18F|nr:NUDIX domain-containing protein [Tomitella biformata]